MSSTVTQALETMLRDDTVLAYPMIAKRATWTVGFIGSSTPTLLTTLREVMSKDVAFDLAADAAWAIGDVVNRAPEVLGRSDAIDALDSVVDEVVRSLERGERGGGRLVVAQAALHSLAIQRDATLAGALTQFARRFRTVSTTDGEHESRLVALGGWGLQLLDDPLTASR